MDGESERRLGRKAGHLLVIPTMMMMSAREMTVLGDLENAILPGENIMQLYIL